ncbi:lipopolysaccharide biosynthesis protein [Fusobacterium mortiferum]|uniref:lipopolysaccharide core heptose(II) kinase RfaY n=1 Tax=Fusobacterium mortiferum TaxID=850 RepID=UPI001F3A1F4B|nr:lipopolysaccharide core heptose(II) kinase RfaY [Fusobacterium mortiferum]MCF2626457.1 lipopolysaccharide biosynthesis protein [Fusobacterium mortiferum]
MKKLIEEKYGEYNLYSFEEKYIGICKKILNKDYVTIRELKNTTRNYVAIIEVDGEKYVYKEPRNEYKLIQRKIMTIFKKGEALNTLINVNKVMDLGVENLAKIYCAVNRREKGMINFSFLLMEWIEVPEGNNWDTNIFNKGIDELVKIHNLGYYHGDFNPTNILKTKDNKGILIDTQLKRLGLTKYKAHYDMITLQYDSWREMEYPYKKDIIYWLAYGVKRFKRLSLVRKIKEIRRGKREE